MEKLVRRAATAAASLAIAAGALLAAGSSATAAALPGSAAVSARTGVVAQTGTADRHLGRYDADSSDGCSHHWSLSDRHDWDRDTYSRFSPWIWDQLETYGYIGHSGPQYFADE